jgi:sarcosine oxidase subunit gamma
MSDSSIQLLFEHDAGHINLRGNPGADGFVTAAESAIGQALPVAANTISDDEHRIFWLGPDEWLVKTAKDNTMTLLQRLQDSLADQHAAVNDLSGGNVALGLSGPGVRSLLAKGCTLDFHPDVFTAGSCAQSGLAKATVLIGYVGEPDSFDVVVRRSFSDYLSRWLQRAGSEYGIEFQ